MRLPRAIVKITRFVIEVSCQYEQTKLLLDPGLDLPAQVNSCSLAHQQRCGRCDTSQASRGSSSGT